MPWKIWPNIRRRRRQVQEVCSNWPSPHAIFTYESVLVIPLVPGNASLLSFILAPFIMVPSSKGGYNIQGCNHKLLPYTKTTATLSQSFASGSVFHYYLTPTLAWGCTSGRPPPILWLCALRMIKVTLLALYSTWISEFNCRTEPRKFSVRRGLKKHSQKTKFILIPVFF